MIVSSVPRVLLIASQIPQQELGLIAQLLQSQGFRQPSAAERSKNPGVLTFSTPDKANSVTLKFYQEIGALRLELNGDLASRIGDALGQYMEVLAPDKIDEFFAETQSDMERRIYAILLVLCYPNATTAMDALREKYFVKGNEATREGIVQGLAFLETPDVGRALEEIEIASKGTELATLARRAIDGLAERGTIRESVASFRAKIEAMIEDNPKAALELIEKYEEGGAAPEIRALHANALRLLGRMEDAMDLLEPIEDGDPDAADAYCQRALIREASGFAAQAMHDVQSALVIDPHHALAAEIFRRLRLALEHASASAEDRLAQYDRAVEATPDDANLRCQRAECYLELGRPADAIADLEVAAKSAPNDTRLPILMAEGYLAMRHLGAALDQATKARKNHAPAQRIDAWLLKIRVYMAMDLPTKALGAVHDVPAELRDAPEIAMCSAIVYESNGMQADAAALYSLCGHAAREIFDRLRLRLYHDLPLLRAAIGADALELHEPPKTPLDLEEADPFFKRCDACGALTMKRRTYCRECSNGTFF